MVDDGLLVVFDHYCPGCARQIHRPKDAAPHDPARLCSRCTKKDKPQKGRGLSTLKIIPKEKRTCRACGVDLPDPTGRGRPPVRCDQCMKGGPGS